jgi:NADH-quinone oxidoreductase subunit N
VLGLLAVMLMAEKFSSAGRTRSPRWAPPAGLANLEATAARAGWGTGEVFPLALFSIAGMMIFPRPTTC